MKRFLLLLTLLSLFAGAQQRTYVTYMGAYSSIQAYNINDEVLYAGGLYISLISSNLANTPSSNPSDWQLISANASSIPNLSNGSLGQVPYQSSSSNTAFAAAPTASGTYVLSESPSGSPVAPSFTNMTSLVGSSGYFPVTIGNGGTGSSTGVSALNALGNNGTGTVSWNNPITSITVNGVSNPNYYSGSDIGAQLNSVFLAMGTTCGTVAIPPGNYSFSTQIHKPRCVHLEGNNAHLTWTGTNVNNPAIVTGSVTGGVDYTWGGISNLYLSGNSSATGIYMGGTTGSYTVPSGTIYDYLETFENVTVSGFYDNWVKGYGPSQDTWIGGASTGSSHSNFYDSGAFGSENMNFFGWQSLNSGGWGFYAPALAGSVYNFTDCSFDYNSSGMIYAGWGYIHMHGLYMESTYAVPFIDGPANSTAGYSTYLTISGGTTFAYLSSTAVDALIKIRGNNSQVFIDPGVTIYNPSAAISEFVDFLSVGSSNQLSVGAYEQPTAPGGITIPAVQPGASLSWLDIPIFSQYTPTSRSISSIYATGNIGTSINYGGSLPSPSAFTYNGHYLGWNIENLGESDSLNPYNTTNASIDAYAWFSNNGGTFAKLAGITRGGAINALGGFAANGTPGFTGTKTAGSCTFTINGGIITNVTGC